MTARDWYGLAVRLAGLAFFVFALFDVVHVLSQQLGLPLPSRYSATADAIAAGFFFVLGLFLTFAAGALTRLTYGPPK